MKSFQLDECFDDKKLANHCNAEGYCATLRFPKELRGTKDHELLPLILTKQSPLVTIDFRIMEQHRSVVPQVNSGVIVIRSEDSTQHFTSKIAARTLKKFKDYFPCWHETNWQGLHLEIWEFGIYICLLHDHSATMSRLEFGPEFSPRLSAIILRLSASPLLGSLRPSK